jgi:curved DNA-binding protein CbpA
MKLGEAMYKRKLAMKWHPDKNPGDKASEVRSRKSTKPTRF